MNVKIFIGALPVVLMMSMSVGLAGEALPPQSVGDLAVFVANEKFKIYSEACSAAAPDTRVGNDAVIATLVARTRVIGDSLLATAEFRDLKLRPATSSFLAAVGEDLEYVWSQQRSNVTPDGCKVAIDGFRALDDNKIKSGVMSLMREYQTRRTLVGVSDSSNK